MNKFCIIKFIDDYKYLYDKKVFLKNKKVRDFYIKKFNPYICEDFTFGELENYSGLKVILPITKNDAVLNPELLELLISKVGRHLYNENVNIILYGEVFIKAEEIKSFDCVDINLFFIKDIIKRVIKANDFLKKDVSICIISGDFEKTSLILSEIYDDLNFLSLIQENGEFDIYEELTDFIFCDSGLEVSFTNSATEADIVINLSMNPHKYLKDISEKSVIIDLENVIEKNLYSNTLVQNLVFKLDKSYLKDYEVELILYAYNIHYRRFKDDKYKLSKFLYAKSEIKSFNIAFCNYKV